MFFITPYLRKKYHPCSRTNHVRIYSQAKSLRLRRCPHATVSAKLPKIFKFVKPKYPIFRVLYRTHDATRSSTIIPRNGQERDINTITAITPYSETTCDTDPRKVEDRSPVLPAKAGILFVLISPSYPYPPAGVCRVGPHRPLNNPWPQGCPNCDVESLAIGSMRRDNHAG
jgi:hypothetical protein